MKRLLCVVLLLTACRHAQVEIPRNELGLQVVVDAATHRRLVAENPEHQLIDLERSIPRLRLDVRYAGTGNFMKRQLYPEARALLRRPAAEALARVQRDLATEGLGLLVFDAYRPYAVTRLMWDEIGDPDYVADPAHGSRHNRGAAVDLTLVELESGRPLLMPTDYDSFEPAAHHGYQELPDEAIRNRERLREVMTRHGFEPLATEWWHYDFMGWREFPLMDLPFSTFDDTL